MHLLEIVSVPVDQPREVADSLSDASQPTMAVLAVVSMGLMNHLAGKPSSGRPSMKSLYFLLPALVALMSVGCTHACNLSDIEGSYQMQAGSSNYVLKLSPDGVGALTHNGVQVEALGWELEPANGQVFVHISRATFELLRQLAGEPKIPSNGVQWKSGYLGLMPICGRSGMAKWLELDIDGQHYFSRVQ